MTETTPTPADGSIGDSTAPTAEDVARALSWNMSKLDGEIGAREVAYDTWADEVDGNSFPLCVSYADAWGELGESVNFIVTVTAAGADGKPIDSPREPTLKALFKSPAIADLQRRLDLAPDEATARPIADELHALLDEADPGAEPWARRARRALWPHQFSDDREV